MAWCLVAESLLLSGGGGGGGGGSASDKVEIQIVIECVRLVEFVSDLFDPISRHYILTISCHVVVAFTLSLPVGWKLRDKLLQLLPKQIPGLCLRPNVFAWWLVSLKLYAEGMFLSFSSLSWGVRRPADQDVWKYSQNISPSGPTLVSLSGRLSRVLHPANNVTELLRHPRICKTCVRVSRAFEYSLILEPG